MTMTFADTPASPGLVSTRPRSDHPADGIGITEYLHLVIAEYRDMPGLSLTARQMQRLLSIDAPVCEALLQALITARVLRRTASGTFVLFS